MKISKGILASKILMITFLVFTPILSKANSPYQGSTFSQTWDVVTENPYTALPQNRITFSSLVSVFQNRILRAAKRTVSDQSDILPYFDKLVHSNGICLSGTWNITEDNPYSGYFGQGSQALIITRISVAMSETKAGSYRGFGIAGKIFPTLDPSEAVKTANFFTIDDLAGTKRESIFGAELTNEPDLTVHPDLPLYYGPIVAAVGAAFSIADRNPGIRQVYPIAQLGMPGGSQWHAPQWMKIIPQSNGGEHAIDFRQEIINAFDDDNIELAIYVSSPSATSKDEPMQKIGTISLTDLAAANGCDHRLHFFHAPFIN